MHKQGDKWRRPGAHFRKGLGDRSDIHLTDGTAPFYGPPLLHVRGGNIGLFAILGIGEKLNRKGRTQVVGLIINNSTVTTI